MAETTFRFIYDSVAATTATSTAGGNTDGTDGRSQARRENATSGAPSRINALLKQSQKSVQEGIKGGLKQLGITLSLGNLLKQSQVFTSSLNAIFQILGAAFDIMLAPLMPYFATALRRIAPRLMEIGEKIGLWMERVYLELQNADSFGSWLGHAVASGLLRGVKDALGLGESETGHWTSDPLPGTGAIAELLGMPLPDPSTVERDPKTGYPVWGSGSAQLKDSWFNAAISGSSAAKIASDRNAQSVADALGLGGKKDLSPFNVPKSKQWGGFGSGRGGLFGTGAFDTPMLGQEILEGFEFFIRKVTEADKSMQPRHQTGNDAVMHGNHKDVDKNRDLLSFHDTGPNSGSTWDDAMGTGLT